MRRSLLIIVCLIAGMTPGVVRAADTSQLRAGATLTGELAGDESGFQVEIGDLDGDRVGDLVIGAWQNDAGGDASGAIYIEYGPITRSLNLKNADAKLFTEAAGEYVGEGPLAIADLDGDRADDLVIGAPGSLYVAQPGSPGKVGEAFLIYGGKRLRGKLVLPAVADARFTGVHMTEWLGFGSSGVGDLDDDGFEELVVGAPATAGFSGAAYLFYGGRARIEGDVAVTDAATIFIGGRPGEMFGYEAAGGDVDGDGKDDLFIASKPLAGGPSTISMFRGGERMSGPMPAAAAYSQIPTPTVDYFTGPSLASGADLTGDGVDDLAVGLGVSLNPVSQPTVSIMGGSESAFAAGPNLGPTYASVVATGSAVAIGDINGDGRPDLIAGAPNGSTGGTVSVFYGPLSQGPLSVGDADASFEGEAGSSAGTSLAAGNVTKDRRVDIAIGAPGDAGRTYVVFGAR